MGHCMGQCMRRCAGIRLSAAQGLGWALAWAFGLGVGLGVAVARTLHTVASPRAFEPVGGAGACGARTLSAPDAAPSVVARARSAALAAPQL